MNQLNIGSQLVLLLLQILAGLVVYGSICYFFKLAAFRILIDIIKNRLKRAES